MIDYNQNFAAALRNVLVAAGMTNNQIDTAIQGELKEVEIAHTYNGVVAAIGNGAALRGSLIHEVTGVGGAFAPATNTWNLTGTNINFGLRLSATEECGAICKYGNTAGFDAAKAVTNLLRLIKAAERL